MLKKIGLLATLSASAALVQAAPASTGPDLSGVYNEPEFKGGSEECVQR